MTLSKTWADWYREDHHPYVLPRPGKGPDELVDVLMCIYRSFHKDGLNPAYVGGLVNAAIRAWKPPSTQRQISQSALQHLRGDDGRRISLRVEHDPPVAFYRDQILHNRSLTAADIRQFVEGMKITLVTQKEDAVLTKSIPSRSPWKLIGPKKNQERRSWKSVRPPDAYGMCDPKIEPAEYPKKEDCPKLYHKKGR